SSIGHPLVFVLASVAVVVGTQLGPRTGLSILLALLLSTLVPTAILLLSGVRSGRWSDADVSVRKERQRFYPWAVPFSLAGVIAIVSVAPHAHRTNCRNRARPNGRVRRRLVELGDHAINQYRVNIQA